MVSRSAEETRLYYEERLGEEFGSIFYLIICEVCSIHEKWADYVSLFGTNETRIALLNQVSRCFFGRLQDVMWNDILLSLARLTDPPVSGRNARTNLTLKQIPRFVSTPAMLTAFREILEDLERKTAFSRDSRNRCLAHNDLELSLGKSARPLELGSRHDVNEALASISNALSFISIGIDGVALLIDGDGPLNDSFELLSIIDDGLRARKSREARILSGDIQREDLAPKPF